MRYLQQTNTLNVVISIIFVVTPMSMIDTIHVVNAIVSKRFIPIRLLTRPANRDKHAYHTEQFHH